MQNEESSQEHTQNIRIRHPPTVFSHLENDAVERDNLFGQTSQAAKTARRKGAMQRQLLKTEATGADIKREGNAQGHGT